MKKILFICICFLTILGCEENKIPGDSKKIHEAITEKKYIFKLYNGFNIFEYVWSDRWINGGIRRYEDPYKIIFREIKDGKINYYVTKYAYSIVTSVDQSQFRFDCFFSAKRRINYAAKNFQRPYREYNSNLEKRYYYNSWIWYDMSDVVAMFNKKDYITWMKQHPETKILNY